MIMRIIIIRERRLKMKDKLEKAVYIQKKALIKETPDLNKLDFAYIYEPLNEIGGDFYDFYKVSEDLIIGILFDVMGNGIPAALSVFAFKILFKEASLKYKDPKEILNYINLKAMEYLSEIYTSSICFSFDFKSGVAKIASAGINKFICLKKGEERRETIIKGPPLGMIDSELFDEKTINFKSKDIFVFFTDGVDNMFSNKSMQDKLFKISDLQNVHKLFSDFFYNEFLKSKDMKDDCTIISFQVK